MADPIDPGFPTSHTTSTTTTSTTVGGGGGGGGIAVDFGYLKSVPGILRIIQIVSIRHAIAY